MGRLAKPQHRRGLRERFEPRGVHKSLAADLALVDCDAPLRADWARALEQTAQGPEPVSRARLRPIPGVGNILALVRLSEMEASPRCPRVQAFVSSCRLVKRASESHGKRPGPSGKKIGHAHRQWAFSEAAGRLLTHNAPAQTYLAPLATRPGQGKALSLRAHTRGRAVYGRRNKHVAFDQAQGLATEGGRDRTSRASHGRHRGQRHPPFALDRASRRVGHEPAPAVPVPHGHPGIRGR